MTNTIILKNGTGIPPGSALSEGELAIDTTGGKLYTKKSNGDVVEIGGSTPPPITTWVRNPTWLPMPPTTAAMEQVDVLVAIYPESNYFAFQFSVVGGYTVDWGDGAAPVNIASGAAQKLFDYNAVAFNGTNGPVTFTDSTDTVNRVGHGYTDGMKISFAEILTTTGIIQLQTYYVVNATADTFQLSAIQGGTVLPLTTDGTGIILPYKQAMVKVTATNGTSPLTTVLLSIKNTTPNLLAYAQPILDATISAACTGLAIGGGTSVPPPRLLETCTILRHNTTNMATTFQNCSSLQYLPLFDTSKVTAFATTASGMFSGCTSLQQVPFFDTSSATIMGGVNPGAGMFNGCSSLLSVPHFNTLKVTNMAGTFNGCSSLREIPLFDTSNVTTIYTGGSTFGFLSNCTALLSVPLFNTTKITSMAEMFRGCTNLLSVPLFDTGNVTSMTNMFNGCATLQTVPLFNTVKVQSFSFMFNACQNIGSIPAFDTTAVTGTTAFTSMFNGCQSLQQLPDMNVNRAAITTSASYNNMFAACNSLSKVNFSAGNGPKFTFSAAQCKLSAAALNQLYTSLPVVVGQTITVSLNVGISGDDPTIATAKGWTVTGS